MNSLFFTFFSLVYDIKLCFFYFIDWNWVYSFHSISFKFNIVSNISIFILFHDFSRELSFSLNYSIKSSCANHKISQNNIFFFNSFLGVFHSIVVSHSTIFTMFNDFFSTWSYSHFYFKKDDKRSKGRNEIESNIRITSSSVYRFSNSTNITCSALNLSTSILSVSHNRSMNKYFLLNISDSQHCILFSSRSCLVIGSLFVSISNWFNKSTSFL